MPYANPEAARAHRRAYRKKRLRSDPAWAEKRRADNRAYCDHRRKTDAGYCASNKDRCRDWSLKNRHRAIHREAIARGIEWSLPDLLVRDLISDSCFYCGAPPNPTNGIDRVNNTRGYTEDNVVTACKSCNTAKLDRPLADYLTWLKRASEHIERTNVASICV